MLSRRSFLAALACLPFVGKYVPQTPRLYPTVANPFPVFDPARHVDPWVPMTFEGQPIYLGEVFIKGG